MTDAARFEDPGSSSSPASAPAAASSSPSPTLAAVIVNYNYGRFVCDAVESVLAQHDRFDEVIVVDDGSTDDSLEVLSRFGTRIDLVAKANGGQLSAVLAGFDRARSDYVYVLDADDYVSPELVAVLRPALASRPIKAQFQLVGVDAEKRPLQSQFPSYPAGYSTAQMRADNAAIGFYICPPTSGNVYRRDLVLRAPANTVRRDEFIDGPLTLAAPYLGEVVSIARPLAYYRVHGKNHSRWDKPGADLLRSEADWFLRRWEDVRAIVGDPSLGPGETTPLYLLERELAVEALENRPIRPRRVVAFWGQLGRTCLPGRQARLLGAWSLLLMVPFSPFRRWLVGVRRSPVNRSGLLKRLLKIVLGRPKPERTR